MNILYLGLQYDKNNEKMYMEESRIGLQGAINNYQWAFVDGLIYTNNNIQICSTLPVGTYPVQYKSLLIKGKMGKYKEVIPYHEVGFINLPLIKQASRLNNYKKEVREWINGTKGKKVIIAYSLYLPFLKLFEYIKKNYPDVQLCMIIPDLPCEYGILPSNPVSAYFMKKYGKETLSYVKLIDYFVLLTEDMKYPLNVEDKPYVVIEGIYDVKRDSYHVRNSKKKIIFYAGTLNYHFGINNLLEAFKGIEDETYELWICGSGEAAEDIIKSAKNDYRIKYFGYLSKDEMVNKQRQATVLINPRTNDGLYTKYSFPSKTIEYMASGIPVLMYKIEGVPEEYYQYIYTIKTNGIEGLRDSIVSICEENPTKLREFGLKAKEFIRSEKNSINQANKVIQMLENREDTK